MARLSTSERRLFVTVAALLLFHIYISSTLPGAHFGRSLYNMSAGPPSKGTEWGTFDLVIPGVVLSFIAGRAFHSNRGWHPREIANVILATAGFALVLVLLLPAYNRWHISPPSSWPAQSAGVVRFLAVKLIFLFAFCCLMSVGVWITSLRDNDACHGD